MKRELMFTSIYNLIALCFLLHNNSGFNIIRNDKFLVLKFKRMDSISVISNNYGKYLNNKEDYRRSLFFLMP